jgi:DNA polymerase-3 subunit delta
MIILKSQDFNKLIQSKKTLPVYLFAGEESYLIEMYLKQIEKSLTVNDLNKEVFYITDSSSEDILNAVHTLPFLSEKRLVIVKDTNKLKAVDAEHFKDYLKNVINTSCLIFLYYGNYKKDTIVKRKEFINSCIASKDCVVVDCRKRYESEVREFIKIQLSNRNKVASYDVIARIIEENGTDLLNISSEIEKLSLFVGSDRMEVNKSDLEKVSGYTKEINIYVLSSNIESRNFKKALFVLEKLLDEGEEPVVLLSVISSSIRKMLKAKGMIEEQCISPSQVACDLKIHRFYAGAFFINLKKYSIKMLRDSLRAILKADIGIKTGSSDAKSALEEVIISMAQKRIG